MAKRRRSTISVNVEVDVDELAEALTDEEILDVAEKVGHSGSPRDVVVRAITMIRSGRIEDGITALEREFLPTWRSRAKCEEAYRLAMGLAHNGVAA
ncbi:hypothetical protein [Sinorhizobium meliloti]|uniref:hypothetical protein n=1 Tax=Rhizobium meliloti TaxID=382 RepID=UPI000419E6CB|nr:hypothetical protein [Sinorhizobium meliloti]